MSDCDRRERGWPPPPNYQGGGWGPPCSACGQPSFGIPHGGALCERRRLTGGEDREPTYREKLGYR